MSDREYRDLADSLEALRELDLTPEVWERAASLAFRLRRRGATVPHVDALIAAAAIHYGYTLLHDDRHFVLIARHEPLRQARGPGATLPA